jgi:hypothetical protein
MATLPLCQVCGYGIAASDRIDCDQCETPHHLDCAEYWGRCSTYACTGMERADQAEPAIPVPKSPETALISLQGQGPLVGYAGNPPPAGLRPGERGIQVPVELLHRFSYLATDLVRKSMGLLSDCIQFALNVLRISPLLVLLLGPFLLLLVLPVVIIAMLKGKVTLIILQFGAVVTSIIALQQFVSALLRPRGERAWLVRRMDGGFSAYLEQMDGSLREYALLDRTHTRRERDRGAWFAPAPASQAVCLTKEWCPSDAEKTGRSVHTYTLTLQLERFGGSFDLLPPLRSPRDSSRRRSFLEQLASFRRVAILIARQLDIEYREQWANTPTPAP